MSIELLLSNISAISKKYELINQKTGGYFNIFDISNIATNEVKICRVIHEFLNPKGSHYQGDTYLRLFMKNVLKMDFTDLEYKTSKVYREYAITNDRRIDLVIEIADKFIPIEVKIYAGDQEKQCYDYYQRARNSNVFYLTLYGNPPSNYSAAGLKATTIGYEKVTQISFQNEIILWLEQCLELQSTIKIAPIREILLQLIAIIIRLTGRLEEDKELEIINIISSSEENIKSAIEIEQSLKACKIEMINKILKAIEEHIGKDKLSNEYDYEFDNGKLVNTFYDWKGSTYPGISYSVKSLDKPDVDLWFRIEIEHRLFAGFCTPFQGKSSGKQLSDVEIKAALPGVEANEDNWWIHWKYLPNDVQALSPNFKEFGTEYFELYNKIKFDAFINECVKSIEKMWH